MATKKNLSAATEAPKWNIALLNNSNVLQVDAWHVIVRDSGHLCLYDVKERPTLNQPFMILAPGTWHSFVRHDVKFAAASRATGEVSRSDEPQPTGEEGEPGVEAFKRY